MPRQSSPYPDQPTPVTSPATAGPPAHVPSDTSPRPTSGRTDKSNFAPKPARKRCLNEGGHKLAY